MFCVFQERGAFNAFVLPNKPWQIRLNLLHSKWLKFGCNYSNEDIIPVATVNWCSLTFSSVWWHFEGTIYVPWDKAIWFENCLPLRLGQTDINWNILTSSSAFWFNVPLLATCRWPLRSHVQTFQYLNVVTKLSTTVNVLKEVSTECTRTAMKLLASPPQAPRPCYHSPVIPQI